MQVIINGAKLRTLAKERNYSVETIAEKLGVSQNTIYQYFLGNRNPNLTNFVILAEMMEVNLEELILRDGSTDLKK